MKIQGLGGYPIAKVPYLTSSLLKMHGKIVTVFDPLKANEYRLKAIIHRIGLLFSALFVYPALGILTLGGCISAKLCVKQNMQPKEKENRVLCDLVHKQIDSAKDRFSEVSLNHNYWWCIEVEVHPNHENSTETNANPGYKYSKANVALNTENYRQFLTVDNFAKDTLSKVNLNYFEMSFKFILVEKNSEEDFNIYSYDRKILTLKDFGRVTGGFSCNTTVPMEAAQNYLKDQFNVECPLDKI